MGYRGHSVFGQKLLNTQHGVGRCACKSPIMKWANTLSLQKNSLKLNAASHNNARWYTDADGFLEHSPSMGVLQGARPPEDNSRVFGGLPSYNILETCLALAYDFVAAIPSLGIYPIEIYAHILQTHVQNVYRISVYNSSKETSQASIYEGEMNRVEHYTVVRMSELHLHSTRCTTLTNMLVG